MIDFAPWAQCCHAGNMTTAINFLRAGRFYGLTVLAMLVLPVVALAGGTALDVRQFGATGDGTNLDTIALQKAIDAAANAGGGTVVFSPGRYLSGSLNLKSHVTLQLNKDAILLGSTNRLDYHKANTYALLLADNQQDITVCGQGVIDGQGTPLAVNAERLRKEGMLPDAKGDPRPDIINFRNCTNVAVRNITLKNSGNWVEDYRDCEHLTVENIKVHSLAALNNDGIDVDGCIHAVVRGCDINSEDDGICLKSTDRTCEDVLVENCRVRSSCNGLKFGTSSVGGFKNIICHDVEIYDTYITGIALEIVDGGEMTNVNISRIKISGTHNAIFIRLGHRDVKGPIGMLHGVTLSDITAEIPDMPMDSMTNFPSADPYHTPALITASITGLPGHPVQDVTLKNISLIYGGIGSAPQDGQSRLDNLAKVPESAKGYPESRMFGTLPAWGFYCRHVEGIKFENVTLRVQGQDYRPALICDEARDITLNRFNVLTAGSEPVIVLNDVHGATIRNSAAPAGATSFIKQMGSTENIQEP
jgi:Glycosyl hydrolases family 28